VLLPPKHPDPDDPTDLCADDDTDDTAQEETLADDRAEAAAYRAGRGAARERTEVDS
jgi:hypothetical protein